MIMICQGLIQALKDIAQELRDIATLKELAVDLLIIVTACGMLSIIVYSF